MKKFSFTLLCALLKFHSSESAGDEEPCACMAEEHDFTIDCKDTAGMLNSLTELKTRTCATNCSSPECVKHYYVIQAHHDYCPEEDIPEEIEDGFHDYDQGCTHCAIKRLFTEGAPSCPIPNCEDNSGNEAYVSMMDNNCLTDCSTDVCREHYFMLRAAHDSCDHDVLSTASEKGLHDMEVPCAAQLCNQAIGDDNQLVCEAPHAHGDGAFEWSGMFSIADSSHTWSMQKVDGDYADPSMRVVFFPADPSSADALNSLEMSATSLIEGDACVVVEYGGSMSVVATAGSCFELTVGAGDDTTFTLDTSGISGLAVFAQHYPTEFERDKHYFMDSSGLDIEPIALSDENKMGSTSGAATLAASGTAALLGSIMMMV
eukprot:CAMPEP_0194292360 /NCGR_PEP_ID=MMETSP0169-20130528/45462_1 /TAXON_ID=218684 /ORGANISM="Corethron pennatum, Strain L29A3" /LENGTH=373 /DNA_ID=CAMNT_0039040519 /DNA_START=17 /DNA_END=1138 /DNA_ORIENTATION=+